jgi:hypothetical protein
VTRLGGARRNSRCSASRSRDRNQAHISVNEGNPGIAIRHGWRHLPLGRPDRERRCVRGEARRH